MTQEMPYALGGLGGLFCLFGAFLLLWRRYQCVPQGCSVGPRTRGVAWALLLAGLALLAAAALFAGSGPGR